MTGSSIWFSRIGCSDNNHGRLDGVWKSPDSQVDLSVLVEHSSTSASSSNCQAAMERKPPVQKDSYWTKTQDGISLHVWRAVCPVLEQQERRQHPCLLIPGLASSSIGTFDIDPTVSLVDFLARLGFEVWTADLRGGCSSQEIHMQDGSNLVCEGLCFTM
jgi:hypothetical protein